MLAATAAAAFCGHLYPLFFRFQGGKGVATAFGALLGLSPLSALLSLIVWLIIAKVFKTSSLAAFGAAAVTPLFLWWLAAAPIIIATISAMIVLLIWRHKGNIQRLLRGKESVIGQ